MSKLLGIYIGSISKIILMMACMFAAAAGFAQDAGVNQLDANGKKHGPWKGYFEDGSLRYEGQFDHDMPYGEFMYYYQGGKPKAVSYFYDDGKRTRTRIFHENGRLLAEGNYLGQEKDSTWNYYSDFDGVMISTEYYQEGMLDSLLVTYYPDGKAAEEFAYTAGLRDGAWKKYFSDGKLKLKAHYVNDTLEGSMIVYYQNGVPEISGLYRDNLKEGLWMYFNDKGGVIKKETYRKGRLISPP